jgi:hypothetical protein
MTEFKGKVEIQESTSPESFTTITLDGDTGFIDTGKNGVNGIIILYDKDGKERIKIGAAEPNLIDATDSSGMKVFQVHDNGAGEIWLYINGEKISIDGTRGQIFLRDKNGIQSFAVMNNVIDGKTAISVGASKSEGGKPGYMAIRSSIGTDSIVLDGARGSVGLGDKFENRVIFLDPNHGTRNEYSALFLGEGKAGIAVLRDSKGRDSITLDGAMGYMALFDEDGHRGFHLSSKAPTLYNSAAVWIGGNTSEGPKAGHVIIRNTSGNDSIVLDGAKGNVSLTDTNGKRSFVIESTSQGSPPANYTTLTVGVSRAGFVRVCDQTGKAFIVLDGHNKIIRLNDTRGYPMITLDSNDGNIILNDGDIKLESGNIFLNKGDISLNNADCAEDFDFSKSDEIEPGTVVVIEAEGKLVKSTTAYDKRVAGVLSGAGGYKPGIVFDKKDSEANRKPVALMGKVYCKVDADSSPIEVGDMLTSSSIAGYAMKAVDPFKAFGAVIGKALSSLNQGQGLIPILVTLQ